MTDLIARIDAHLRNDDAEQRWLASDNLIEEAQAEIERLRLTVMNLCGANGNLEDERDDLHEEVRRLRVEAGYD